MVSSSDGPTDITGNGLALGFSHTPQGSVLAASQIMMRWYYGPPQVRAQVAADQVLGPEWVKQQAMDLVSEVGFRDKQYSVPAAIRVDPSYTPTFSRVSFATGPIPSSTYPAGHYYSVATWTVVWDDGQWKLRLPDDGLTPQANADSQVESIEGWSQW